MAANRPPSDNPRPGLQATGNREPRYFSTQVTGFRRFYLEFRPGDFRELQVVSGGMELCRPDYEVRRANFPFASIELVVRGGGTLQLGGKAYELTPGTLFCYGPHVPVEIKSSGTTPMMKYFAAVHSRGISKILKECHLLPGSVAHLSHPDRVVEIFEDLIRYGLSDHPARTRMCSIALEYLLMKADELTVREGPASTVAFKTYQRCRMYIEKNHASLNSMNAVAEACRVDRAYLCRLFQKFGRQSPFQFLQQLRMNHAADLLQNSRKMVKETAGELGFSDPYNFSRAFKRVFGVSPKQIHPGPE